MSHIYAWLVMLLGIIAYRSFSLSNITLLEHIAGLYFAALALLLHAIIKRGQSGKLHIDSNGYNKFMRCKSCGRVPLLTRPLHASPVAIEKQP